MAGRESCPAFLVKLHLSETCCRNTLNFSWPGDPTRPAIFLPPEGSPFTGLKILIVRL